MAGSRRVVERPVPGRLLRPCDTATPLPCVALSTDLQDDLRYTQMFTPVQLADAVAKTYVEMIRGDQRLAPLEPNVAVNVVNVAGGECKTTPAPKAPAQTSPIEPVREDETQVTV